VSKVLKVFCSGIRYVCTYVCRRVRSIGKGYDHYFFADSFLENTSLDHVAECTINQKTPIFLYFFGENIPQIKTFVPGTDVMIFKIFSPKNSAKKLTFLAQNKAKLCKVLIITLVLEKNAILSPKIVKNCRKL
jgi:hypothetical protein